MDEQKLIDVRTPLAAEQGVVVEVGRDGTIHVELAQVSLKLERDQCERVSSAMARALLRLRKLEQACKPPNLRLVSAADE